MSIKGLKEALAKKQAQCPNAMTTIAELSAEEWDRLTCKLFSVERVLLQELPRCAV